MPLWKLYAVSLWLLPHDEKLSLLESLFNTDGKPPHGVFWATLLVTDAKRSSDAKFIFLIH